MRFLYKVVWLRVQISKEWVTPIDFPLLPVVICVVRFAVWWWWWGDETTGLKWGAISGTISIDGGAGATVALLRGGMSYQVDKHCPGLQHLHPLHLLLGLPLGNQWWQN